MEAKNSIFTQILLSLIALCSLAICAVLAYQVLPLDKYSAALENSDSAVEKLEKELLDSKSAVEKLEKELLDSKSAVEKLEKELLDSKSSLAELEISIERLTSEKEIANSPSVTPEYKAWLVAKTAVEPYDLYDDLSDAYNQFVELYDNGYNGTVLYDATLKLLVPSNKHQQIDAYIKTLERYFGASSYYTARSCFIEDLVNAKLLTDDGNGYYSYNKSTLITNNVMSKLNVTTDVAEALLGLLRTIGWDV